MHSTLERLPKLACARRRFVAAMGLGLALAPAARSKEAAPAYFDTTLRYALKVRNPTAQTLRGVQVAIFAPAQETAWHSLQQVRTNQKYTLQADAHNNAALIFKFDTVPPHASQGVNIETDVRLYSAPRASGEKAGTEHLAAEPLLETDDAEIRAVAADLKRSTERETARAIYEWAHRNLHYSGYATEAKGAKQALLSRAGDCTEYAYLSAALARALGIPARVVSGFVVNEQKRLRATGYHDWAEVYVDGRWRLLDAQRGVFDPDTNAAYVMFAHVPPRTAQSKKTAWRFTATAPLIAEFD